MTELFGVPIAILVPVIQGVFALVFLAGGIYYLEQRVARIRDQFPTRGPLARLTGYAALGIGVLAAVATGGYLAKGDPSFRWGALVAATAGVAFWVFRIHVDLTPMKRVRDVALAFICAALAVLSRWWASFP
jgi:hypothetical protein